MVSGEHDHWRLGSTGGLDWKLKTLCPPGSLTRRQCAVGLGGLTGTNRQDRRVNQCRYALLSRVGNARATSIRSGRYSRSAKRPLRECVRVPGRPYSLTLLCGGNFHWEKEKGVATIHCPDPKGITLEPRRIEKERFMGSSRILLFRSRRSDALLGRCFTKGNCESRSYTKQDNL